MEDIVNILTTLLPFMVCFLVLAAQWKVFVKMGIPGWKSIIPIYNTYCLLDELYGEGWKIILYLIPFYGQYFALKVIYDMVKSLGRGGGYFIGMCLFPPLFIVCLALDNKGYINYNTDGLCVPALLMMILPAAIIFLLMLSATPLLRVLF